MKGTDTFPILVTSTASCWLCLLRPFFFFVSSQTCRSSNKAAEIQNSVFLYGCKQRAVFRSSVVLSSLKLNICIFVIFTFQFEQKWDHNLRVVEFSKCLILFVNLYWIMFFFLLLSLQGTASPTCATSPPSSAEWAFSWWEPASPGTMASWDYCTHNPLNLCYGWAFVLTAACEWYQINGIND